MPQFDSGAAEPIGRFSEGLLLRLLHSAWTKTQSQAKLLSYRFMTKVARVLCGAITKEANRSSDSNKPGLRTRQRRHLADNVVVAGGSIKRVKRT
jgi:hypothetical protein